MDVVLPNRALLAALRKSPGAPDLNKEEETLRQMADESSRISVNDMAARQRLFAKAVQLRRQIALRNPLLHGIAAPLHQA